MVFRNIAKSQFERPNIVLALLFIALPTVLLVAVKLLIGISPNVLQSLLLLVKEIIYVVIVSAALYVFLLLIKGKTMRSNFAPIFSAYSVIYVVIFLAALVSFVLVSFFIPGFFAKVAALQSVQPTFNDMLLQVSSLALPAPSVLLVFIGLMGIIGVATFLSVFAVLYRIFTLSGEGTPFSNLVFSCVFLGFVFVINVLYSAVFSLILGLL